MKMEDLTDHFNDALIDGLDGHDGRKAADALRLAKENAHLYREIVNFEELSANDPWKRLAQDETLQKVREEFLQGQVFRPPPTHPASTRRSPAVTAQQRLYRVDNRLRRVVTKACHNSLPAARVVLTLETYVRSVYKCDHDAIISSSSVPPPRLAPPPGQWWSTLLYQAPTVTQGSSTTTTHFVFDGQSSTGGFHRLLLQAVCQYHGLTAVSRLTDSHRVLLVTGKHCAPDSLLTQLIDDADQLALLEEPWTLVDAHDDDDDYSTLSVNPEDPNPTELESHPDASTGQAPLSDHSSAPDFLSPEQIATFQRDGLLVVDSFLSPTQLQEAHQGLASTLRQHGVDLNDLNSTGHKLASLSSTGGSGGVLDIFYQDWQLDIALDSQLLTWTQQLWKAMYLNDQNASREDLPADQRYKWHPHGTWEENKAFAYLDRICYRLPTTLSQDLGVQVATSSGSQRPLTAKQKKKCTLQRSLTPHLDCCPETYDSADGKSKWRPIQCFVSLTDNTEPDTGGFEVAPGFHHDFYSWTQQRSGSTTADGKIIPPPCLGEYTHIRPTEDKAVMDRIQHVPVRAGSVVFWDNRLPHANAYRHNGTVPRVVVYCSFLPCTDLNRRYAQNQLARWRQGRNPTDQWIASNEDDRADGQFSSSNKAVMEANAKRGSSLSPLARKLLAVDEW